MHSKWEENATAGWSSLEISQLQQVSILLSVESYIICLTSFIP